MTIDPAKFEAQGLPTPDLAKAVWIEMGCPGCRKVAVELEKRGWKIAWRTLNRWKAQGWAHKPDADLAAKTTKQITKTIQERQKLSEQQEVDIVDARIKELFVKSEAELDIIEQRSRKILNIVLAEAAARRVQIMMLIPKDIGTFVNAMTEASKQTLTGGLEQTPKAGDPRVIEGDATDVTPPTPLQEAIRKFKREKELT
jgi:hypothetical protein